MKEPNNSGVVAAFVEVVDAIFYEGYAQSMAEEQPELYLFDFNQFLNNYDYSHD